MERILLVSHRLPVTVCAVDGAPALHPSSGGLATGLASVHQAGANLWIGSLGDVSDFPTGTLAAIERQASAQRLREVRLSRDEYRVYYEAFSNGVIWPLFHYMPDRIPLDSAGWQTYREVNRRFAQAVVAEYRPGDLIWVHDYHLMLVPELIRQQIPHAQIGFFLHIPFPAFEVFRTLPWRAEVLTGLLGADIVGFHTAAYVRYFRQAVGKVLGRPCGVDRTTVGAREVLFRASPLGVDPDAFARLANDPAVQESAEAIRAAAGGRTLILGIDRLDYTKGIPRRLLAFERALEQDPDLRDRLRMIQVAVPCRDGVEHYRLFRRQLDELVGRINGTLATASAVPIHYLHRSVSREELVALYLAADVMAVTPLRDGMNLVAKEFVASRIDGDGVLLLSEFAGATEELSGAILVNPYDVEATATAMRAAIDLPEPDRRSRMSALRRRVSAGTVHRWSDRFVEALRQCAPAAPVPVVAVPSVHAVIEAIRGIQDPVLLLDYDGTLVPIASAPELAHIDPVQKRLLRSLAGRIDVHVVSGRARHDLDAWLADVPVTLWAEHGAWRREPPDDWVGSALPPTDWMRDVRPVLDRFAASTPGAFVEEKHTTLAWHYRTGDEEFLVAQARALRTVLAGLLHGRPLDLLEGDKVIEIRPAGISKAAVVRRLRAEGVAADRIVAIGDDRTDEEMFAALPEPSVTVRVGGGPTVARYSLSDPAAVRLVLVHMTEMWSAERTTA